MRYIRKKTEPESFTEWKQQQKNQNKAWKNLNPPIKRIVRSSLLKEQGYLCCYCEIQITDVTCCIDHLIPQSSENPSKDADQSIRFDYRNLLASCRGENEDITLRKPAHCEQLRGTQLLPVSPLDINCAEYFRYTEDGQMLEIDNIEFQELARQTIERLGLNIPKLQRLRREAIRRNLQDFETLTQAEIKLLVQGLMQPDLEGKYTEFGSAVVYQLKQLLMSEGSVCDRALKTTI